MLCRSYLRDSSKMEQPKNIKPLPNELPSYYADRLGILYSSNVADEHKKTNGQFFTPPPIAHLMASFSSKGRTVVRILDPGCGTAILTCALAEYLATNKELKKIYLTVYETDVNLVPYSEFSLSYLKKWLVSQGIILEYFLCIDDFVLNQSMGNSGELFDIIISNPPYFKLSKEDSRAKAARSIVTGHTNIYSVFMAIAAQLLSDDGEIIFIIPRSFASGSYFKTFREYFFDQVEIENIHLFASRKDTFGRDKVLQETVIIKGHKSKHIDASGKISLSTSFGLSDISRAVVKYYVLSDLIDMSSKEKMLHLPTNKEEEDIIRLFRSWTGSLHKYNIQVSTGPVVAFRSQEFIHKVYKNGTITLVPLIWIHNVNKMQIDWPVRNSEKGEYINVTDRSRSLLLPNKNYILLRRFSTKDDKSRLIAAPYFSDITKAEFVGVENKVNYIYRPNGVLEHSEIIGLSALFNSNLFDTYFKTFNGNVNVSATELREITLPPLEQIKELGRYLIQLNDYSMPFINKLIEDIFEPNIIQVTHE